MPDCSETEDDRRRTPRFNCAGHAEINCLPSSGIILPGTIRDLSLNGCCIDLSQPIDCGSRAEILVRVNASSFRAVGEVRALRGRSGSGIEFVHLSAGGRDLLEYLIADLARLRAVMNKLRSGRRGTDDALFRMELKGGNLQKALSSERFALLRTILPAENAEEKKPESASEVVSVEKRLVVSINLFV
jgi:hypothetical protein